MSEILCAFGFHSWGDWEVTNAMTRDRINHEPIKGERVCARCGAIQHKQSVWVDAYYENESMTLRRSLAKIAFWLTQVLNWLIVVAGIFAGLYTLQANRSLWGYAMWLLEIPLLTGYYFFGKWCYDL